LPIGSCASTSTARTSSPAPRARSSPPTCSLPRPGISLRRPARSGCSRLRDIVTRHRRRWTEEFFGKYLDGRWRADLTEASNAFSRRAADKAQAPTPKQFAPDATTAANNWFGGDLTGVYRAIGLKLSFASDADLQLPADVRGFITHVYSLLDVAVAVPALTGAALPEQEPSARRAITVRGLARGAVLWVQLREALGRSPELKHYPRQFEHSAQSLGLGIDDAWAVFSAAVEGALAQMPRDPGPARA
jgi:hypothetical protein